MGIPVITLAGSHPAARVGASLVLNAGSPELVAASANEYVALGADWGSDLERLADLRATLRERMAKSQLMDTGRFARGVEAAFREMWRRFCVKR